MFYGRKITAPLTERTQPTHVYFRSQSENLNVSRSDGKRLTFQRGWYKTNNVEDIAYLDLLESEGQIGIFRVDNETAELDFTNALTGSAAELAKIEKQIAADPRFASALANILSNIKSTEGQSFEQIEQAVSTELERRNTESENAGMAISGMGNSQGLAAAPSVSSGEQPQAVDAAKVTAALVKKVGG